ncbi:hypothetical protein BaRGS_00027320, partial [Batillaria attramentaria]
MSTSLLANLMGVLIAVVITFPPSVTSHGRMLMPPSRMSAWRFPGLPGRWNPNDHIQWCGDLNQENQTRHEGLKVNDGTCGVCGDRWDRVPRKYELPDGYYMKGVELVNTPYTQGQTIDIQIQLTQSHWGYFEFRLCNRDSLGGEEATHACLDENLLELENGLTRFQIPVAGTAEDYIIKAKLPDELTCEKCLLQWKYNT